jgi:hypothetical protein
LINFREFVSGLSKDVTGLRELGWGWWDTAPGPHIPVLPRRLGLEGRSVCKLITKFASSFCLCYMDKSLLSTWNSCQHELKTIRQYIFAYDNQKMSA